MEAERQQPARERPLSEAELDEELARLSAEAQDKLAGQHAAEAAAAEARAKEREEALAAAREALGESAAATTSEGAAAATAEAAAKAGGGWSAGQILLAGLGGLAALIVGWGLLKSLISWLFTLGVIALILLGTYKAIEMFGGKGDQTTEDDD